jgi:signal peptidase I
VTAPELIAPGPPAPPLWKRLVFGRNLRRTLLRAAVMAATAFVVFGFILWPVRIDGDSMYPTYRSGRVNFINQLAYRWHKPRRGDVVGVMLSGPHMMYFKRIVALPGETVAIDQGIVLINGRPLEEPYVKLRSRWVLSARQMGNDEYFFIGDNRGMPLADHSFGAAAGSRIAGKVLW